MSVPVDLDRLPDEIAGRGGTGYLLTGGDDHRPHVTHVVVEHAGGRLRVPAGRRSAANALAHPAVSLLFPPTAASPDAMSLIVDGDAEVEGEPGGGYGARVVVRPTFAVFHRPAR